MDYYSRTTRHFGLLPDSISKCKIWTLLYGEQLQYRYLNAGYFDDIQYWKVINYSQTEATVYYIKAGRTVRFTIHFLKNKKIILKSPRPRPNPAAPTGVYPVNARLVYKP